MFFAKWCYTTYTIPKSSPAIKAFHYNISDQFDQQSQSLNQHHSFLHQSCEPSIVYMILPFRLLSLIHFHFQIRMSIQTLVQSHFRIIIPTCVLILFRIHFQISTLINSWSFSWFSLRSWSGIVFNKSELYFLLLSGSSFVLLHYGILWIPNRSHLWIKSLSLDPILGDIKYCHWNSLLDVCSFLIDS